MIDWRIYYDNGHTFDPEDGGPMQAPGFGVICIAQRDPEVGRVILHGWDFYYQADNGQWWGSDIYGVLDRLLHRLPVSALCAGRTIATDDFRAIMARADKDPDFPPKSARRKLERP